METQTSRIFKVLVLFQEKDEVFYTKIKITDGVPASLFNIICTRYPSLSSLIKRCYVKDKSGAEFSIINNDDLAVFLEGEELFENVVRVEINGVNREPQSPVDPETPPKRVRIEEQQATPSTAATNPNPTPKDVHENVVCDCCDEVIVGFRYKCTECFNYDLCMTCEGKMRHREHIMIRIPSPSASPIMSPQRAMKWAFKKGQETAQPESSHEKAHRHHHGKRHHHRRCQRGPNAMFDGLFRQLNEDSPVSDPDVDVSPQEGTQPANTGAQQQQHRSNGMHPPMYDYQKIVKGVETVAGMVSKLFDPLGISLDSYVDYGINVPPPTTTTSANTPAAAAATTTTTTAAAPPQPTAAGSHPSKTPEKENVQPMEATSEIAKQSSVTSIESTVTDCAPPAASESSPEPFIIDVVDEPSNQSVIIVPTTDSMPMSPFASNNSEDNEWLVISSEGLPDNSMDQDKATQVTPRKESLPSTSSSSSMASTSAQTTVEAPASVATASAQTQGYDELARKLQKDIEEQLKINSSTAGTQTSMPPTAPIVHHPVPHINHSVVRMMEMGFSNEGGCLTELMAACNGDVRRALDSLLYKK